MQREGREKSHNFSNLIVFFTLSYSSAWVEMTDTNPRNQDYTVEMPTDSSEQHCQWRHCYWSQSKGVGFLLSNQALCYHFSSLTPFIWKQLFPRFTAIHTCVTRNINVPGYQPSRCWCWCGMRMLSTSLGQDKWKRWRWWLRAVINALRGSGVAVQGCPRVGFVAHFLAENRCWFCCVLMFPCRTFHTIFTW